MYTEGGNMGIFLLSSQCNCKHCCLKVASTESVRSHRGPDLHLSSTWPADHMRNISGGMI